MLVGSVCESSSSERLEEGVDEGRIKESGDGPRFKDHMLHFPHSRIGGNGSFKRKRAITDEGWKHLAIATDAMIHDMASSQGALCSNYAELDIKLQMLGGKDGKNSQATSGGHDIASHMETLRERKRRCVARSSFAKQSWRNRL